jgi:hypothetical protein
MQVSWDQSSISLRCGQEASPRRKAGSAQRLAIRLRPSTGLVWKCAMLTIEAEGKSIEA